MSENSTRNSLKNWAKEIMNELNDMDENNYLKYKNFVIRIFSTILIYRASNNLIKDYSKEVIKKDNVWNKVQEIYNKNNFVQVKLEEIDDEFFYNVLNFLVVFCDNNYECLDNMLAWLYQYLNINRTDNIHKDTQFFTDQYIVEYLVNESISQIDLVDAKKMDSIDPACGGGNFIVALVEKLYYILNLDKDDFVEYIGKHIFGYDIDKNLAVICVINIYIKFLELGVLDIRELFNYNLNIYYDEGNNVGALMKCNIGNTHTLFRVTDFNEVMYNDVFNNRYTLLITNPPFKGRREQDKEIRGYITKNYSAGRGDICNSFVERLFDLLNDSGIASFVMQNGWMYLETFKELRKKMLLNGSIVSIVDLGSDSFCDLSGEKTNIALLIYTRKKIYDNFNIYSFKQYKYIDKSDKLKFFKGNSDDLYKLKVSDILNDEDFRIEYLSKGNIKSSFNDLELYSKYAKPMQGTSTGDSKKFVKYHWEVENDSDWCLVSKGGGYCKWTGLNIYKVKWGNNGEEIKSHPKSVIRNTQYFDNTDLVYSDTGTSGLSVRLLRKDQIFIASGPGIYIYEGDKYCHLAFLNSRLASYYIKVLTPKLTISATYIGKIPIVKEILHDTILRELSKSIVKIKEYYNEKRPINYEYKMQEFTKYNSIYEYAKKDFLNDLELELEKLKLEKKVNERIIRYYNFSNEEIEYIYSKVGKNPYEIDDNICSCDVDELDRIIEKILDNNCYVKSTRSNKVTLGIEGVLESLAINNGINVEKAFSFIKSNIDKFEKTILKYYKHTLHRIKLAQIGYLKQKDESITEEIINNIILNDKLKYNLKFDEELWFRNELYKWHYNSFLKKPIITNGDIVNE